MALGAVTLAVRGGRRTQDEEGHTQVHVLVLVLATLTYFSLATGQGVLTLPGGRAFPFARYLDWCVTTPLLLLGLAMTALVLFGLVATAGSRRLAEHDLASGAVGSWQCLRPRGRPTTTSSRAVGTGILPARPVSGRPLTPRNPPSRVQKALSHHR